MIMAEHNTQTAMAREIGEIPAGAQQLVNRFDEIQSLAERIGREQPRVVAVCGRGSSGNVGVYLRYLFETHLRLLVSPTAPSVVTTYRRPPDMTGALFVLISQSGRSPDLVMATEVARTAGALTLAIVNDGASPAADAADLVLPIGAGPEKAVAATKTVALSMVATSLLAAALAEDAGLSEALRRLPDRLQQALKCDWSAWGESIAAAPAAFVAARGYGLGTAREIALKATETMQLPALGFSAAELRHGPRAAVKPETPVLILRQNDESASTVDDLAHDLRAAGETVFLAGGPASALPWIGDDHPLTDVIAMLVPAYRAIEAAARRRGLDPDRPEHLTKVTQTL